MSLTQFYSGEEFEDDLSKVRKDFSKYIATEVYKRIGKYGHFYKLPKTKHYNGSLRDWTFQDGKTACEKINGHILQFDETDPNIQDFFKAIVKEFGEDRFWIGLTDLHHEGSFKWIKREWEYGQYYSKTPYSMSLWRRGEPNNVGSENCVELDTANLKPGQYELVDVKCTEKLPTICQRNTIEDIF